MSQLDKLKNSIKYLFQKSILKSGISLAESGESTSSKKTLGREVGDSLQTTKSQCMTNLATGTFTGLSLFLALLFCGVCNMCSIQSVFADDSISVTISGNPTVNVAPTAEGTFADSGNINISVSSTVELGYTLAITGGGNTSLTGKTDSSKAIESISSAMDQSTFDTSANNNKWGYKPSMYYDTAGEQRATNANYLPSPGANGDIIDITDDDSDNTYTLSIGTRVTSTLGFQSYENNTFTITAIANTNVIPCDSTKLCVEYDGNGLEFDGEVLNRVNYDSVASPVTETKYSHSSNVNDAGISSGTHDWKIDTTDTVNISGARILNVDLYYHLCNTYYDGISVYQSPFTISNSNDYSVSTTTGNLSGRQNGCAGNDNYSTWYSQNYTVVGDTVKFHYVEDKNNNHGYYAIVTSQKLGERNTVSGEYIIPTGANAVFYGWSTTKTTPGAGMKSDVEFMNESEVMSYLSGNNGEIKNLYAVWGPGQNVTFTYDNNVTSIDILYPDGDVAGVISDNGGTILLGQGNTYTIDPNYISGYGADTITKTLGEGIMAGNSFTVGTDSATINTTTINKLYIQYFTTSMCKTYASSGDATVIDKRDDKTYTVRYINGNCWMTKDLSFKGNYIEPNTTDINIEKEIVWKSASGSSSCSSSDTFCPGGGRYNYSAATAGTITGKNKDEAIYSICPKGWTLPTYRQQRNLWAYRSMFNVYEGLYRSGGFCGSGTNYAFYWSSTFNSIYTSQYGSNVYRNSLSSCNGRFGAYDTSNVNDINYIRCIRKT